MKRMWVNQPSKFQPLHEIHGVRVLAQDSEFGPKFNRVWFTSGKIVSMEVPASVLSDGWPESTNQIIKLIEEMTPTSEDNLDCDDATQTGYHREGTRLNCPTCIRARVRVENGGNL
jgi:hypothetical protein